MLSISERGLSSERSGRERPFLVIAHGYQPHREPFLPSGNNLRIVPEINERIYNEVYKPILSESENLPRMIFSFYPGLRDWLRSAHPAEFKTIIEKINQIPDKEYKVLGDPYIHLILPLQTEKDQNMLFKIGKKAFKDDFGFEPKGVWLPETAVSHDTLNSASENGYEFVALRDSQLYRSDVNPIRVNTKNGKGINIVHFNSGLSGSLSFDDGVSLNADDFLESLNKTDLRSVAVGSDLELYGHHKKDRDKFLEYLERPETLEKHGFTPFDTKNTLKDVYEETGVIDSSSWSCEHFLGRWKGECSCDNASENAQNDKRNFYMTLNEYGIELNARLDAENSDWRGNFINFFLHNREIMFGQKRQHQIDNKDVLFWAKYCELVGKTSCGWFFGGDNTPERDLPKTMIKEIENLVPDITQHIIYHN